MTVYGRIINQYSLRDKGTKNSTLRGTIWLSVIWYPYWYYFGTPFQSIGQPKKRGLLRKFNNTTKIWIFSSDNLKRKSIFFAMLLTLNLGCLADRLFCLQYQQYPRGTVLVPFFWVLLQFRGNTYNGVFLAKEATMPKMHNPCYKLLHQQGMVSVLKQELQCV